MSPSASSIERAVPAVAWIRGYSRSLLPGDLTAGVVVALMLVPQSLAYAMLADLPPAIGLYASVLPVIVYAIFGSSRLLAVGPVAVISLMTGSVAATIGPPGSPEHIDAALTLALMSGLMLGAFGLLRLGMLASLLSHPVVSGFISASAILIALSQIKHLIGVSAGGHAAPDILVGLVTSLGSVNFMTIAVAAVSLVLLFQSRTRLPKFLEAIGLSRAVAVTVSRAAPAVVVLAATATSGVFDLKGGFGVATVGEVPAGLPPFVLPSVDPGLWVRLLPGAAMIALVGFVESVSVAQSLAAKRRQSIDPDQELIGLGAANIASALSFGMPVTGGFARSVVNEQAGANSPLASIISALLIALAAIAFTPLFGPMPQAVLAATIVVAVIGLVDMRALGHFWRYDRADAASMAATGIVVLLIGVEAGIAAGVGLSIALHIWRTSRPHIAIVGRVPGTEHYRNIERHKVLTVPQVLAVRIDESLYFANARVLEDRLGQLIAARPEVRHLLLILSAVNAIDSSALESLETLQHRLKLAGIELHLAEVKGPVMDRLSRGGFHDWFTGRIFLTTHQAMQDLAQCTTSGSPTT